MSPRRASLAFLFVVHVTAARAAPPASVDLATAEALFVEGKALSVDGSLAEACARFEASMALVPRLGVQLNLADCDERLGKTASAWVAFGEAAALARRLGDQREAFARERQDALVPRLARLRVTVADAAIPGLAIRRDGVPIAPSAYGLAVPVDPGAHSLAVEAPGRIPWSTEVVAPPAGETTTIEIPPLARRPAPPAAPSRPVTSAGPRRPPLAFWITSGVATVGIGAGAALGLAARSLWQEARADCDPSNVCTDAAYALATRSRRDADLATIAFAAGGAALVSSVVLYLAAPRERAVRVVPQLASRAGGLAVVGAF